MANNADSTYRQPFNGSTMYSYDKDTTAAVKATESPRVIIGANIGQDDSSSFSVSRAGEVESADSGSNYGGGYYSAPAEKDWGAAISDATAGAGTGTGTIEKPSAVSLDVDVAGFTNPNAGDITKKAVEEARASINAEASIDKINKINTDYQKNLINQITEAQKQQANNTIDYGTNTSIAALQRAETDAAGTYNTQLNEIARDEQRALDNQVLYNRARGDNGGVGQSQYNSIQNTAAVNRLTVKNAQTKLSTDTARQIADLRAQGEYERADKLLEITQNYLSQLLDLEQYEQTTNLGIDEFNTEIDKWLNEYRLNVQQFLQNTDLNYANATGAFSDGTLTQSAYSNAYSNAFNKAYSEYQLNYQNQRDYVQDQLNQQNQMASVAQALISAGVAPTEAQLQALGLSNAQGAAWLSRLYPYG